MATQFVSTPRALSTPAAVLDPSRRAMAGSTPIAPTLPPRGRRREKAVEDSEKLLLEMLPLVKRVALRIRKRLPARVELDDLFSDGVLETHPESPPRQLRSPVSGGPSGGIEV